MGVLAGVGVLAGADAGAGGAWAWMETSSRSNVEFYSRLGFGCISHWRIADGAGPDLWLMVRPPVAAPG